MDAFSSAELQMMFSVAVAAPAEKTKTAAAVAHFPAGRI
jgi:hypothetical protein